MGTSCTLACIGTAARMHALHTSMYFARQNEKGCSLEQVVNSVVLMLQALQNGQQKRKYIRTPLYGNDSALLANRASPQ